MVECPIVCANEAFCDPYAINVSTNNDRHWVGCARADGQARLAVLEDGGRQCQRGGRQVAVRDDLHDEIALLDPAHTGQRPRHRVVQEHRRGLPVFALAEALAEALAVALARFSEFGVDNALAVAGALRQQHAEDQALQLELAFLGAAAEYDTVLETLARADAPVASLRRDGEVLDAVGAGSKHLGAGVFTNKIKSKWVAPVSRVMSPAREMGDAVLPILTFPSSRLIAFLI